MTDPKNSEVTNEELDLEQLKDATGGLCFEDRAEFGGDYDGNDFCAKPKHIISSTSGPGGTSYLKDAQKPKTGWSSNDSEFNG